ncbi:MAG: ATPase, T2SS/T4P/T4SS family [Oscillospiraceae bacterium]
MREYYDAISYLPQSLRIILNNIPSNIAEETTEIRLRRGCAIVLTLLKGFTYVKLNGLTSDLPTSDALIVDTKMLESCILSLCGYSVYSVQECINKGYIPMGGGHRAGVCGRAYQDNGKTIIKNITSINIRVARRDVICCDKKIINILEQEPLGLLIAGAPSTGKTTILKGIIKQLSSMGKRVSIVDERCELSPHIPLEHCDILSAYPKNIGMQQAIRSLSPEVIICDEIGGEADAKAIELAANSGVGIVMTVHAINEGSLYKRPQIRDVLLTGAFNSVCFLKNAKTPSAIERIVENDDFTKIIGACYGELDRIYARRIQGISA